MKLCNCLSEMGMKNSNAQEIDLQPAVVPSSDGGVEKQQAQDRNDSFPLRHGSLMKNRRVPHPRESFPIINPHPAFPFDSCIDRNKHPSLPKRF
jgi:hypothetical protein